MGEKTATTERAAFFMVCEDCGATIVAESVEAAQAMAVVHRLDGECDGWH